MLCHCPFKKNDVNNFHSKQKQHLKIKIPFRDIVCYHDVVMVTGKQSANLTLLCDAGCLKSNYQDFT